MKKKFFLIALLSILTFLPSAYALYYGPSTLLHFVDPYDLQGIEDKFDRLRNMLRSDLENDTRSERSTRRCSARQTRRHRVSACPQACMIRFPDIKWMFQSSPK
jgi:hypothetical protein